MPCTASGGFAAISRAVVRRLVEDGGFVGEDVVHEVDAQRGRGVDVLAGERKLARVAVADDAREALERAHVRDDRELHLANGELHVLRAEADVARGHEVDSPPIHGPAIAATTGFEQRSTWSKPRCQSPIKRSS